MSNSKYVDVLLAEGGDGTTRTFVVPTSKAHEGDVIFHDGCIFTVIGSAWCDVNSDMYSVLEGATTLYIPDKIMQVKWEKEEEESE